MAKKKIQARSKSPAKSAAKTSKSVAKAAPKKPGKPTSKLASKPRANAAAKPAVKTPKTGDAGASKAKAAALELLHWVHGTTEAMVHSFPEEKAVFQTSPTDNHLLWNIGHLATAYSWFASLIDGRKAELPGQYDQLFGYKSQPVADTRVYPPLDEVKANYASAYQRLIDAAAAMKDDEVYSPTKEESHGFAASRVEVVYKAAWHDGWHSGQISSLRRGLGLQPIM